MKILFPKSLFLALGVVCLPALAVAQSYLPLPQTSAPVYRPVSGYYASNTTAGSSLISEVGAPPVVDNSVPAPGQHVALPSPAKSYGNVAAKRSCCGKGAYGAGAYGAGYGSGSCGAGGCLGGLVGGKGSWYAAGRAIWMDRDSDDEVYFSVFDNALDVGLLSTDDAQMQTTAGGEVTIGRYLGCGCNALEVTYWGIDPTRQEDRVLDPNAIGAAPNLISAFDMTTLNYDDGVNPVASIDNWFNNARAHLLTRDFRYDNLELNFVHHSCTGCCSGLCGKQRRYNVSMLCGIRYIDMDEDVIFAADDVDTTFDGGFGEVKYCIDLENQLLGFQLGARGDYYVNDCLALHTTCKVGIYGNRVSHHSFVGGINGAATVGAGPNAGREFDIYSNKTDVAMLGELDLGASYQLSCRWRATAGYRVLAISGVALPGDQIPSNFADIDGVADIGTDGSLLLHGGYAGLEFCY